jgi:anthranilate 1,2-dioxygenase large subunit
MTISATTELKEPLTWPEEGVSRVPYRVFYDEDIYAMEHEKIFRGPIWNYLCLDIEIPEPGDYKTSFIGEIPVIVARDMDGEIHAMVNRCAHKGALVCLKEHGNERMLTCVYHSWSFDLTGQLRGVAFRNGSHGKGGMPDDFDPAKHRLEPIRVELFCGMIFGTFSDETPPFETFLGERMSGFVKRSMGRPIKLLGVHSQIMHHNWKLYAENLRDSYHATLLHTFYTTFKINRLDMDGGVLLSDNGWHSISYAKRDTIKEDEEYAKSGVHAARYDSKLNAPEFLETFEEFDDGITHAIQPIFPSLCVQLTLNSLAVRFYVPRGVDKTELFWFYLGCEDDTEAQTQMRIMQHNLTGSAGLVSLEDGCINEFVQRGARASLDKESFLEMGGRDVASSDGARATETAIRGFWKGYRELMGV